MNSNVTGIVDILKVESLLIKPISGYYSYPSKAVLELNCRANYNPILSTMANNKMKGLLKGLRYISQIFDGDQKEQEMQIGHPTDVKHVAHLGCDGPLVNSPAPDLPKPSRRRSSTEVATSASSVGVDSPTKAKVDKARQSRRPSKGAKKDLLDLTKQGQVTDSPSRTLPDVPKKSRRKNSKESSINGGRNGPSRFKAQAGELYIGSESGSVVKANNNSEHCHASAFSALEEADQEFTGIS